MTGSHAPLDDVAVTYQYDSVHRGHARIAYRLAAEYGRRLIHVHGIGWHEWDGTRWREDTRGAARRAVLDVLRSALASTLGMEDGARKALLSDVRKCESAGGVLGVLTIASALQPLARTIDELDQDPYLLNVANGTLDLRTMELRDHNPADLITKVTGAAYDPQAIGTRWNTFLERVLPDVEVRAFLQRYTGHALAGAVLEHVLAILTGSGRNGKGVYYGAVEAALGDYAAIAEPDLFMHRDGGHPTGEMDLRGVRWVVVSETEQDRKLAESTVKRLTGGDRIKARRMRQDFVEFAPSHTAALVTNHLPKVRGDDPALWARLRVIPFNVTVPKDEQNPHLGEELRTEIDSILTWVIAGWDDYRRRGRLDEPEAVTVATSRYQSSADALGRFITECCLTGSAFTARSADLYARYLKWAGDDGSEVIAKKPFGQALEQRGFTQKRSNSSRLWGGIGLAADDDEPSEAW